MKTFSFFLLLTHVAFHSIIYSQTHEVSLTKLQIPFVLIGDPGNSGYYGLKRNIGAIDHSFFISKYEVTVSQYCDFLNAVASQNDPHQLYKNGMTEDPKVACISRTILTKEDGSSCFYYEPFENRDSLPITYVNLRDAQRFCNWLENNAPTSDDDPLFLEVCTEKGAYLFLGGINGDMEEPTLCSNAHYYIPSEDEWFKAAYYKGGGNNTGYWAYPTSHDAAPNNGQGDVSNQANYRTMATGWKPREQNPMITPVDHFDQTCSAYGVYDMGGNIAEWTSSFQPITTSSDQAEHNIVRGGSWNSEYSIYWNNELMAQGIPQAYDPLTANNFIGFRIAAVASEEDQDDPNSNSTEHCSHANDEITPMILWTIIRSTFCPRTILQSLGFSLSGILGLSVAAATTPELLLIMLIDLVGYFAVTGAVELIKAAWSYFSEKLLSSRTATVPQESTLPSSSQNPPQDPVTLPQAILHFIWGLFKAIYSCGSCLMVDLVIPLLGALHLTTLENLAWDVEEGEFWGLERYMHPFYIKKIITMLIDLGVIGLLIVGYYIFLHYWPAIQDSLAQLWHGIVNCSGISALDLPGLVY
jgi:formylglycine-generating enzyme required for sulfatase activity